eukprot:s1069_g25.t1
MKIQTSPNSVDSRPRSLVRFTNRCGNEQRPGKAGVTTLSGHQRFIHSALTHEVPADQFHGCLVPFPIGKRLQMMAFLDIKPKPLPQAFYAGNVCAEDPSHCVSLPGGFQSLAHNFCKDSGQPNWCKDESQSSDQCLCPGRVRVYLEAHPEEESKFDKSGCPG